MYNTLPKTKNLQKITKILARKKQHFAKKIARQKKTCGKQEMSLRKKMQNKKTKQKPLLNEKKKPCKKQNKTLRKKKKLAAKLHAKKS